MVDRAKMRKMRDEMLVEWNALGAAIQAMDVLLNSGDSTTVVEVKRTRAVQHDAQPKGVEAIRRVLAESPGVEMDVKKLTDALIERGWGPVSNDPVNATSSTAGRAAELIPGIVRRRAPGSTAYFYRYDPGAASVVTRADSQEESPSTNGHHAEGVMT